MFLRALLIDSLEERITALETIADGVPMVPGRMLITELLALFGTQIAARLGVPREVLRVKEGYELAEVEVLQSAPVRDRVRAIGLLLEYGLGRPPREIHGKFTSKADVTVVIQRGAR